MFDRDPKPIDPRELGIDEKPLGLPQDLLINPSRYRDQILLIEETVSFLGKYGGCKKLAQKEGLVHQLAFSTLGNLPTVGSFLNNINLIYYVDPSVNIAEIQGLFMKHLDNAARESSMNRWSPEKIEQLVQLSLDASGTYAAALSVIKRGLFNGPETIKKAVDLYYNSAWAMINTTSDDVREEIFSTLCLEKPWFTPHSMSAMCFNVGGMFSDDEILLKYEAAAFALATTGVLFEGQGDEIEPRLQSERAAARAIKLVEAAPHTSPVVFQKMQRVIMDMRKRNPKKFEKLMKSHLKGDTGGAITQSQSKGTYQEKSVSFKEEQESLREDNLYASIVAHADDPLKSAVKELVVPKVFQAVREHKQHICTSILGYERLTDGILDLPNGLELLVLGRNCQSPEEKQTVVRDVYHALANKEAISANRELHTPMDGVLDVAQSGLHLWELFDQKGDIVFSVSPSISAEKAGKLASIIEHFRPLITLEQAQQLSKYSAKLRQDINLGFRRSVGRRGYRVIVSDPALHQLEYEAITFKQGERSEIQVALNLAGQEYAFSLSPNYRVIEGGDIKRFKGLQDQMWLEVLVLSHLMRVMCMDDEDKSLEKELLSPEKQSIIYRKQVIGRREYLREQAPGYGFSQEAFERCLTSGLPEKNLYLLNQARGKTRETGMWTYVSPVGVVDVSDAKPIKVAFKNASADLRRVIDLGAISQGELVRLENEILGELETI